MGVEGEANHARRSLQVSDGDLGSYITQNHGLHRGRVSLILTTSTIIRRGTGAMNFIISSRRWRLASGLVLFTYLITHFTLSLIHI